jgi:hypothetical protein
VEVVEQKLMSMEFIVKLVVQVVMVYFKLVEELIVLIIIKEVVELLLLGKVI